MSSSSLNHPTSLDLNLAVVAIDRFSIDCSREEELAAKSENEVDRELQLKELEKTEEEYSIFEGLQAELDRITLENKKLNTMLESITCDYTNLWNKMIDLAMISNYRRDLRLSRSPSKRKRKISKVLDTLGHSNCGRSEEDSCKKLSARKGSLMTDVWKVQTRVGAIDSNSIVKDDYQWKKYGQKVTKDNPNPRAYFKCSMAPSCPVKKKVQRSVEDATILVATYKGKHNHNPLLQLNNNNNRNEYSSSEEKEDPLIRLNSNNLVEQMAQTLSKDPSFAAALANVISGRIMKLQSTTTQ